jgi:uncharacterized protein (TIGR02117 family)
LRSVAWLFVVGWAACLPAFAIGRREAASDVPVWLVSNGFHSAVGLRVRDAGPLLARLVPTRKARWLVIGWGDADFYRASRITPWLCVKATIWPGASVMHVVSFARPLPEELSDSDIVEFRVSPEKMCALRRYLEGSFELNAAGEVRGFGRGYYPESRFYAGRERFYFPKTCNVWTAVALKRAGVPIFVPGSFMADPLLWQAQRSGHRLSQRSRPLDAF